MTHAAIQDFAVEGNYCYYASGSTAPTRTKGDGYD